MTQEDRKETIEEIYAHLESIVSTAERMTSGNFMHHKNSVRFSANVVIDRLKFLGL